jgi:NADH-quinone oxidoreductase subunit A
MQHYRAFGKRCPFSVDSSGSPFTITAGLQREELDMANYSVLLVAALVVISLPVLTLFILAPIFRASRANKVTLEPYECGVPAFAFDHRFSVRYFLIAVLFIVFDVETVFLFPWAIRFKQLGWFGAVEMATFLAILLIGYFYAWKRKVLSWV